MLIDSIETIDFRTFNNLLLEQEIQNLTQSHLQNEE